jgi:hypothetical protein
MQALSVRIHRLSHIGVLLAGLVLPPALAGQAPVPEHVVRVTVRDSVGRHRLVGHLMSVAPDSLMLRVINSDSVVKIDRSSVSRIERGVEVSFARAVIVGCVAVGGALALAGSQVRDPDSPGIETVAAVVGGVLGCVFGGGAGFLISSLRERYSWEEITV